MQNPLPPENQIHATLLFIALSAIASENITTKNNMSESSSGSNPCGIAITFQSEIVGPSGTIAGRAEAFGEGSNLALVTVTLPDGKTRSDVHAVDFEYIPLDNDGASVSFSASSSSCSDETKATAYVLKFTFDPLRRYGVSAKSKWPQQEVATTQADITIEIPDQVKATYKDRIQLTCIATDGTLSQNIDDPLKWKYTAFEEKAANTHPKTVSNILIHATLDGTEVSGFTKMSVLSIFYWLVRDGHKIKHQHGPGAAPHEPNVADYTAAYNYLKWKYGFILNGVTQVGHTSPVQGFNSVTFLPDQSDVGGADARTSSLRNVTFSSGAFRNENWCASVIAHELIHTGQAFPGTNASECEAYTYQLDHASDFGLQKDDLDEVKTSKDQYCK